MNRSGDLVRAAAVSLEARLQTAAIARPLTSEIVAAMSTARVASSSVLPQCSDIAARRVILCVNATLLNTSVKCVCLLSELVLYLLRSVTRAEELL